MYVHVYTYVNIYIHTHTYTYMFICMHIYIYRYIVCVRSGGLCLSMSCALYPCMHDACIKLTLYAILYYMHYIMAYYIISYHKMSSSIVLHHIISYCPTFYFVLSCIIRSCSKKYCIS